MGFFKWARSMARFAMRIAALARLIRLMTAWPGTIHLADGCLWTRLCVHVYLSGAEHLEKELGRVHRRRDDE